MPPLTDIEKQIIALALFGYAMRAGPLQFQSIIAIADKLAIGHELTGYTLNWVATSKNNANTAPTINNDAKTTVQFAIFHGIITQWHKKDSDNFAEILKDSVYRELFEGIHYRWAIKELIDLPNPDNNNEPV
jgi:hypothetical protein